MFRAKCRWVEQANAEQNIFCNMGKRNHNKKTIRERHLEDDHESTTIDDKQILDQIEAYFRDL